MGRGPSAGRREPEVTDQSGATPARSIGPLVAMVVVTLASVWYVASQTNFAELRQAFAEMRLIVVLPFLLTLAAFYWLKTRRWRLLLWPLGRFRFAQLWPSLMAGFAFNNLLPAHLGEFVRMAAFSRQSGLPKGSVLSTIALERLFDVLAILLFLSVGLLGVDGVDSTVRQGGIVFLVASVGLLAGSIWYVFDTDRVIAVVATVLGRLPVPNGVVDRVIGLAESGAVGLAALRQPALLLQIGLNSLLQWALNGIMIWLSLWSFGVTVSPAVAALVLAAVAFGVTLPSTPGYFGVLQGAFVLAMSGLPDFESQRGQVVAASIAYHAMQWVPVTAVGLYGFRRSGLTRAELTTDALPAATDSGQTGNPSHER